MSEPPACDSDSNLFYRIRGDAESAKRAFEELYNRHAPKIYRYCLRILGEQAPAEDVLHETFIRFYQSARQERLMTNVEAYLLRIARNLCLNAKRSKHNATLALDDVEMAFHDVPYERKEIEHLMLAALDALPEQLKEVLILREYNGLSYNEIAEVVGATVDVVSVRIHRARKKLQQLMAPYLDRGDH